MLGMHAILVKYRSFWELRTKEDPLGHTDFFNSFFGHRMIILAKVDDMS